MNGKYQNLNEDEEHGSVSYVQSNSDRRIRIMPTRNENHHNERIPRVYELPLLRQTPFIQKSLAILLFAMSFTLGMVYLILRSTDISRLVEEHYWLQAVAIILFVVVVFVVVCMDYTIHHAGRNAHIAILIVMTILMTLVLTITAAKLDANRDIVFRSVLFTELLILFVIIYTIQSTYRFNSCCGYSYVLIIGIGAMLFIYLPYLSRLFSGNISENVSRIDWTDEPPSGWSFVISVALSILISLYFMTRFFDVLKRCSEDDYVYAAYRVYTDLVSIAPMLLRMNLSCSGSMPWSTAASHSTHAVAAPTTVATTTKPPD